MYCPGYPGKYEYHPGCLGWYVICLLICFDDQAAQATKIYIDCMYCHVFYLCGHFVLVECCNQ